MNKMKTMLNKRFGKIGPVMYKAEKLTDEELRLMQMLYEKKNPGGVLHCRTVLNRYKTILSIYGLEDK